MMLAADLTTYYNRVRRHLDCPKDEQNRLLLGVNKQVIELQADAPNLDYDGIVEFLGEPESLRDYPYNILNFIILSQKKPELSKNLSFKSNGVECGKEPLKYFERPLLHL